MGSLTKKVRIIRKNKKKNQGQTRKAENRNKGTTPKFAIHKDKKEDKKEEK